MIQKLSSGITKWLEQESAISGEDRELFSYAVYSLLFGLLPVVLALLLGLIFGMPWEALMMIMPFIFLRKFSGGYHLNSPKLCVICSTILLTLALVGIRKTVSGGYISLLTGLVVLSVTFLFIFSPVENDSRKLTQKEKCVFHKIACVLALIFLIGYLVMCKAIPINYAVAFGVGIILAAVLQILGVIEKAYRYIITSV